MTSPLPGSVFESLRRIDTCTASNAVERLSSRLRNEGFVSRAVTCRFPDAPPLLGYAATARIRTSSPPIGGRCYYHRMDWWNWLATVPAPRVLVIEDADHTHGMGALVGEVYAAVALALNCVGCVTNGAVRDLPEVEALGFQLFSGFVSVSHAYAHVIDFGNPVTIGGLVIQPGDLMHGDRHGVHVIPREVAADVPGVADQIRDEKREWVGFCQSPDFCLSELSKRLACVDEKHCTSLLSRTT